MIKNNQEYQMLHSSLDQVGQLTGVYFDFPIIKSGLELVIQSIKALDTVILTH